MTIFLIALARLKELAAQRLTLALMMLVPLAGCMLTGALIVSEGHRIPIAVVDEDGSEYARLVTERLAARTILDVVETDRDSAIVAVQQHRLEAALVIEPGFEQRLIADGPNDLILILKSPASLSAELAAEYLASEVMRLASNVMAANEMLVEYERRGALTGDRDHFWQEVWEFADAHWEPEPLMQMIYREHQVVGAAPQRSQPLWHQQVLYGLLSSFVLFNTMLTSSLLLTDRLQGILRRVATTAAGSLPYLAGTALAIAAVGALTLGAGAVGLAYFAGAELLYSPGTLALLASYLAGATGLSVLVGTSFHSERYWQATLPILTVVTGLLGTGATALGMVSERFAHIAWLTPQGWLLSGVQETLLGSSSPVPIAGGLILLALGLVGFGAGWRLSLR